jgi:hypothetical protein
MLEGAAMRQPLFLRQQCRGYLTGLAEKAGFLLIFFKLADIENKMPL